jgi:DNA replication protein DnaC
MPNQQTTEKLHLMRLRGMAEAFTQQHEEPQTLQLSFEERFGLLVDCQWNWRQNRALERRLRDARLQGTACMEDIDYRAARGLDKLVVRSLIQDSDWVRRHQHIFLVGPTGIGKTYLARAFGQKALTTGEDAQVYLSRIRSPFRRCLWSRRVHRLLRHCRAVVPGTGVGAGRWQLREEASGAWPGGCSDRR